MAGPPRRMEHLFSPIPAAVQEIKKEREPGKKEEENQRHGERPMGKEKEKIVVQDKIKNWVLRMPSLVASRDNRTRARKGRHRRTRRQAKVQRMKPPVERLGVVQNLRRRRARTFRKQMLVAPMNPNSIMMMKKRQNPRSAEIRPPRN